MKKLFTLTQATMLFLVLQVGAMADLVAHYQFDGNLNDSVTSTAATTVGTTPTVMFVDGPEAIDAQAVDLSGSGWYINCSDSLQSSNTDLTVSAWIYDNFTIPASDHGYFGGIVMRDGYRNGDWGLRRYSFQGSGYVFPGRAQMVIGDNNNESVLADVNSVPSGEWVLLTATYKTVGAGSEISMYVNGELSETATFTTPIDFGSTQDILIGYDAEKAAYFDGLVADVRIYNEALDATAVAGLMTVPEPSTFAMLGFLLLASLGFGIRRK